MIIMDRRTLLITGFAGFIGASLAERLLKVHKDITVVGIDNMNDYYDVGLKKYRVERLINLSERNDCGTLVSLRGVDIADKRAVEDAFRKFRPSIVVNLAAQAGVRYSIENPGAYISSNLIGFYNILEECRHSYDNGSTGVTHLVYASSSSVYGDETAIPFSTEDRADRPVSLYAATKRSNELLAYCYSKLYGIPSTGLRFFTVYGPAGRPDMAYFGFTDKLRQGKDIEIFNYGNCKRDFTYIDDIVEGICRVMEKPPARTGGADGVQVVPHAVYNIGHGEPVDLLEFVDILQQELVRAEVLPADYDFEAHKKLVPMQPGDVPITYADTSGLEKDFGYRPKTSLREGLRAFAEWYKSYYGSQPEGRSV